MFSIILTLLGFAKPIRREFNLISTKYHINKVKCVPLNKFTKPGINYLRFIPEDLENIKHIPLQPTLPANYNHNANKLIGNQPCKLWGRKTIVLDLDETLFTTSKVKSWIDMSNRESFESALRPFHKPFIQACKQQFEVVVWTRSDLEYASKKCELLGLKDVPLITGWRDCDKSGAKPLYKLNREASQILLVDDDFDHLSANPRSQLLIPPWHGDENDCELESLIYIINKIAKEPTVQDSLDICLAQSYNYEKRLNKISKRPET